MPILPGWDTVEGAERWGNIFTVLGLVSLAGLVLFDVLAFVYGRREKRLSAERIAASTAQQEQEKQQQDRKNGQQISSLQSARRADQDTLQQQQHQIQSSNRDLQQAQKLALSEDEALLDIEKRIASRTITSEEHAKFVAILKPYKGSIVSISRIGSGMEIEDFTDDILSVLKDSEWKVRWGTIVAITDHPVYGLLASVDDRTPAGSALVIFLNSLPDAGVEAESMTGQIADITIGLKTPP